MQRNYWGPVNEPNRKIKILADFTSEYFSALLKVSLLEYVVKEDFFFLSRPSLKKNPFSPPESSVFRGKNKTKACS